ncbi:MAG: hypothetical protein CMI30_11500 [Opitutae bacterium]|nr:hypothetical protein [Opitutae bacterium]
MSISSAICEIDRQNAPGEWRLGQSAIQQSKTILEQFIVLIGSNLDVFTKTIDRQSTFSTDGRSLASTKQKNKRH